MPIPTPTPSEDKSEFIARCMSDSIMISEYTDAGQRLAICQTSFNESNKKQN